MELPFHFLVFSDMLRNEIYHLRSNRKFCYTEGVVGFWRARRKGLCFGLVQANTCFQFFFSFTTFINLDGHAKKGAEIIGRERIAYVKRSWLNLTSRTVFFAWFCHGVSQEDTLGTFCIDVCSSILGSLVWDLGF